MGGEYNIESDICRKVKKCGRVLVKKIQTMVGRKGFTVIFREGMEACRENQFANGKLQFLDEY